MLAFLALEAHAQPAWLHARQVADNVYALVGPTQNRTHDNHALNNTLGFVVTRDGVVLIDSGASRHGARLIEAAVGAVTPQPSRWVINLGVQDHRWLDNAWFAGKGARIIVLQRTADGLKHYADNHVALLKDVLKDRFEGTAPLTAPEPVQADQTEFELGGVVFSLRWLGDAHYRDDAVLFLPQTGVLFAGDLVFHDRMPGVWPHSPVDAWRDTFHTMERLNPRLVVSGHGEPGDLARARRDTSGHLDFLMDEVAPAAREWKPLDAVTDRLADQPPFSICGTTTSGTNAISTRPTSSSRGNRRYEWLAGFGGNGPDQPAVRRLTLIRSFI